MHDELLAVAQRAALEAAEVLLARFGRPVAGLDTKSSATDPVSDADRRAEEAILQVLRRARPGDGIVAEEGGAAESETGLVWVVDPLDGTVNYLYGIPHWAVSIAVEDADGSVAGVVADPCRDEMFTAVRGRGAWLDAREIRSSSCVQLGQALIATGFGYDPAVRVRQAAIMSKMIGRVRDIRRAGTASLDLAWTACGRLDGYYESGLKRWDLAAGSLLVEESGGRVATLPRRIDGDAGVAAAAPGVYDAFMDALAEAITDPAGR